MSNDTIRRALELARSGSVQTFKELRRQLDREHCDGVDGLMNGALFKKQLRAAMDAASADQPSRPDEER